LTHTSDLPWLTDSSGRVRRAPVGVATYNDDFREYLALSRKVRRTILDLIYRTRSPHIGPSFSAVEILTALYFKVLNNSPEHSSLETRDRFIMSKGHACPALYAVLAERGYLRREDLKGFAVNNGQLQQHPDRNIRIGIELSTGSLGHGLSVGAGMALAGKIDGKSHKVYVLLGDGELNEGSTWEAVMFAGHHKLSKLVALVDYNKIQALGHTKDIIDLDPMADKWAAFGWHTQTIDGHDFGQIFDALASLNVQGPNVVILNTVKGKGVSFMEHQLLWHYRAPDSEEYHRAIGELSD
jgi:transketolase